MLYPLNPSIRSLRCGIFEGNYIIWLIEPRRFILTLKWPNTVKEIQNHTRILQRFSVVVEWGLYGPLLCAFRINYSCSQCPTRITHKSIPHESKALTWISLRGSNELRNLFWFRYMCSGDFERGNSTPSSNCS